MKYYRFSHSRHWLFQYALWPRYWRLGFFIASDCVGIQFPPVAVVFFYRKLKLADDALRQAHP
jgi:hypothetical protein